MTPDILNESKPKRGSGRSGGKIYRWEYTKNCLPKFLTEKGEVKKCQPPFKSLAWIAFSRWAKRNGVKMWQEGQK